MPFYINRRWMSENGTNKSAGDKCENDKGRKPEAEALSSGPLGPDISTGALMAWQRQEIARLQKENRRIQAEKDRLYSLLEREQSLRNPEVTLQPLHVSRDPVIKTSFKNRLLSRRIENSNEEKTLKRRRSA